ncbi:Hypothetical predicted protein [Mytilus galloprovincialis]|uniref:Uncharacterized protein n=1 Tax=Mytilus galloprovincialis TaxID=29158 RepID=A0A8B6H9G9_MYTGA|nr:Hypothetical predicted protein [Mytilus galloprovincialis]
MKGMREVEGVEVKKLENFPFSAMKVLGGIQIGLGIACMFLGIVDLIMFVIIGESELLTVQVALEANKTAKQLTISSTGLWCGLWKIGFMVLSIVCGSLFGPVCLFVNAYAAIIREKLFTTNLNWMVPLLVAFFALVEIAIAILSSAVSCCCSAVSEAKVRVFIPGGFPSPPLRQKSNTSMDYFTTSKNRNPANIATTKRLEWPDTGMFKNNNKHSLEKI